MAHGVFRRIASTYSLQELIGYPILINGTDSTVRVDVEPDHLKVNTFNSDGTPKSKLPDIP